MVSTLVGGGGVFKHEFLRVPLSLGECVAKHRVPTFGLLLRCLILNHIPVLDQNTAFNSDDVRHDPVRRKAQTGETTVHDYVASFAHDDPCLALRPSRLTLYPPKHT